MSRTYRRKNTDQNEPYWARRDLKKNPETGVWAWTELEGDELINSLNDYHSDGYFTMYGSPPRWWRKMHWHCAKRKADREVHRWLRNEEYEPQVDVNPGWPYWW